MGAPVIAAAALNTRTGRKILMGALLVFLLVAGSSSRRSSRSRSRSRAQARRHTHPQRAPSFLR
jgi:hypothetical protein